MATDWKKLRRGDAKELEVFGDCPFCGVFRLHLMPSRSLRSVQDERALTRASERYHRGTLNVTDADWVVANERYKRDVERATSYLYLLDRRCVECQFTWSEVLRKELSLAEAEALRRRYPEGLVFYRA